MIQESPGPCFPSTSEPEGLHHTSQLYHDLMDPGYGGADPPAVGPETQLRSILCSLTILKQKAHEVETLISMFLSQESPHQVEPFASVGTLIQEIVANASSMMFNCQQMTIGSPQGGTNNSNSHSANDTHMQGEPQNQHIKFQRSNNNVLLSDFVGCGIGKINTNQEFIEGDSFYNWYNNDNNNNNNNNNNNTTTTCNNYINLTRADSCSRTTTSTKRDKSKAKERKSQLQETYDLVEPEAADLLAKYTHYCHVCGKGFKRDANLRMHMRAHGDEYKSSAALSNPLKKDAREVDNEMKPPRKYSCPQQGCRWNKNHAKFQPLKSIICVKNHYKRTHCPKMYVCKRCNRKHFSVLSDLRTHEKHCGDRKWLCSCGTTFSRKDKLMGHVSLFVGHTPIVTQLGDTKLDNNHGEIQIQFEDRC